LQGKQLMTWSREKRPNFFPAIRAKGKDIFVIRDSENSEKL
jgi:hypothetical protein